MAKNWFLKNFCKILFWQKPNKTKVFLIKEIVFVGKTNLSETMQIWHLSYPSGELRQISADTSNYANLSVSADSNTISQ
jgi:hypothetical protein